MISWSFWYLSVRRARVRREIPVRAGLLLPLNLRHCARLQLLKTRRTIRSFVAVLQSPSKSESFSRSQKKVYHGHFYSPRRFKRPPEPKPCARLQILKIWFATGMFIAVLHIEVGQSQKSLRESSTAAKYETLCQTPNTYVGYWSSLWHFYAGRKSDIRNKTNRKCTRYLK